MKANAHPSAIHFLTHNNGDLVVESSFRDGRVVRTETDWASITEAVAFKKDCLTVDLVCIAFGNEEGSFEVNEDMDGWKSLLEFLPQYLPGCQPEEAWYRQIVLPAFATNPVTIFRRQSGSM